MLNELLNPNWKPTYQKWRHGGWYVTNLVYPNGAVGCVAPVNGGYVVVCGNTDTIYRNRKEAVEAERQIVISQYGVTRVQHPSGTVWLNTGGEVLAVE